MATQSLSQPELTSILLSAEYSRALAQIALYTESTDFEGGFKVGRDEDGFKYSPIDQGQGAEVNDFNMPYAGLSFSELPGTVASFHTHPYYEPLTLRDFGGTRLSNDDVQHMQRHQIMCPEFIAGVAGKDNLRADDGIVVSLYRATRPLPTDPKILEGDYWRTWGSGDSDQKMREFLGIAVARVGFDLVRADAEKAPATRPNAHWGDFDTAVASLFV